ncbi:endonuclease/exonuclease/phosphatase family protein [uncultured Litoreibacter sp.]|uniref:endonuclease/exonuclease/phosphatase family protein n=1 Tax=uncultured Litoreibacter sp. TaxID=1392394 RepID=UPI002635B7FE|nr:endonuclease/exonuclease/phosphatase family protein [uncultured Litoreibacter sp.]
MPVAADTYRILTYNTGLSRDGPGLLVRDLLKDEPDPDLLRIAELRPDVAVLQNVDFDHDQVAVKLIQKRLRTLGHEMPHAFTARPNTGIDSGFDLDRNGKLGQPRDMLGYGRFAGQGGMLLLSRFPLADDVIDLSGLLWRDEEPTTLPKENYFSEGALGVLPLHSVAAWDVGIRMPGGPLRVLMSHASTPVFDGPEDRNGLRNAAELQFWHRYIAQPHLRDMHLILAGTLNNDPIAGEGLKPPLINLLSHRGLQDPSPKRPDGQLETAQWASGLALRVDYILPSPHLGVRAAGIEQAPFTERGTRHFPVWIDVAWQ